VFGDDELHRERAFLDAAYDRVVAMRNSAEGMAGTARLLTETIRRHDIRFVPFDAGDLRITYALVWRPDTASAEVMAVVSTVQEALRTR